MVADGLADQVKASPVKSEESAELAMPIAEVRLIFGNIAARAAPILALAALS